MFYYSKTSTNCLVCKKICDPPSEDEDPDESDDTSTSCSKTSTSKGKKCSCYTDPTGFLGTLTFKWEENKSFHESLKYAFVLRKLLDYPRAECVQYLRRRCLCKRENVEEEEDDNDIRQDGWFSICQDCSKYVDEGHSICHKIEELESRLNELKSYLKETIIADVGRNEEEGGENRASETDNEKEEWDTIYSQVRNHFLPTQRTESDTFPDQSIVKNEIASPTHEFEDEDHTNTEDDGAPVSNSDWSPSDEEMTDVNPNVMRPNDNEDSEEDSRQRPRILRRSLRRKSHFKKRGDYHDSEPGESDEEKPTKKRKSTTESMKNFEADSDSGNSLEDKTEYPCGKCCAIYMTKHRLREHEKLHSLKKGVSKCEYCPFVSQTEKGLLMHFNKCHQVEDDDAKPDVNPRKNNIKQNQTKIKPSSTTFSEDYKCSYCEITYKTEHRLKTHEELHSRNDVLKCESCKFVCLLERGMKIHVTKHHGKNSETSTPDEDAAAGVDKKLSEDCSLGLKKLETVLHRCNICNTSYKLRRRLKEHKLLHQDPNALKCSECPFVCRSRRFLKTHIGQCHSPGKRKRIKEKGPFNCNICPAVYHTPYRFREHMNLHQGSSSIFCEKCGWVFSSEEKRDRHIELRHLQKKQSQKSRSDVEPYKCDHCSATYKDRYCFKDHVQLYHKDKLIQCQTCEQFYESKRILEGHQRICKKPEVDNDDDVERPYKCEHCDVTFTTKTNLKTHTISLHSDLSSQSSFQFPCSICSVVFMKETQLKFHMARKHDKIHNVCKECGYKAHGASHLRLHMQKHTKQKMYMCEICSKTFVSSTYLTAHKQKVHYQELGMQPIKCDKCDMLFPTQSILKYHTKKVHDKDFKFFCETCGKGFLFASSLRNHRTVHSTERNEICQYCGAAYVHNRVLVDHIKNHHPEEYAAAKGIDPSKVAQTSVNNQGPFTCKFCQLEFPMRWTLHNHLKTHTEVYERYKCGICGKGYSSQAGVKRHEETAHLTVTFTCEFCRKEFSCRDYLRYHIKNHCRKKDCSELTTSTSAAGLKDEYDPHVVNKSGQLHIVTSALQQSPSNPTAEQRPSDLAFNSQSVTDYESGSSSQVASNFRYP